MSTKDLRHGTFTSFFTMPIMGTSISTKRPASVCLMSLSFTSTKYWAKSLRNWNDASKSSMGTIFTRMNFMPIRSFMMLWLEIRLWFMFGVELTLSGWLWELVAGDEICCVDMVDCGLTV
ncbi:hypothetical protein BpHYR1_043904 [Brachionus plicatilis]|uniref:Uncharacterized protein n=1 Tax=Brachionus plicatilis TaxID=10195 RepID=A0A3M7SSD6_BRAPC|nr:hypothetical protein BpHYR1_043904 [Brachionus plicatilis]